MTSLARQGRLFIEVAYFIYNNNMLFEYDPAKSATNKAKHGIDFDEAQVLWKDARMLEAPAKTDDEPRFLVIGKIGDNHLAAVCAHRGDTVRIISVRRARKQEIDHYESQ